MFLVFKLDFSIKKFSVPFHKFMFNATYDA